MNRIVAGALIATLGAALACTPAETVPEDSCPGYATATCQKLDQCMGFWVRQNWGSVATCIERTQLACTRDFTAPGITVTHEKLSACSEAVAALSCDAVYLRDDPAACRFDGGPIATGTPCGTDSQCKSGFCSRKSETNLCGVCADPGGEGAPCTESQDCAPLHRCAGNQCRKTALVGESCANGRPCMPSLSCVADVCVASLKEGEMCEPAADTCDNARVLYCSFAAMRTCVATLYADPNLPCGFVDNKRTDCATGRCTINQPPFGGVCTGPAADGEPCSIDAGPDCLPPARCENARCTLPHPESC